MPKVAQMDVPLVCKPGNDECDQVTRLRPPQFNTRLASGLSSENVGTSISKFSPLSLIIW